MSPEILLHLRHQALTQDAQGYNRWEVLTRERIVPATSMALLVCDVWDKHWSRGATERVNALVPRMNAVLRAARERGAQIIHAPSDTMTYYAGTPARERMLALSVVEPPAPLDHPDPPLPVDASDQGSDTGETQPYRAWTCQHPGIEIDPSHDGISDNGREVYNLLQACSLSQLLILGVHTNMCILERSFGIKQMVRWGIEVALIRDLTDAMYNPARPPYVSHAEGTRLVIEYIEKFWCPTLLSEDLLR